ncbi:hypothetical protein [Rhizorhabdus wittichii]|uniref:Uncharacterized protein n=1 Tax=Rhizorhabdus wittichii TaxID=160791 RepID=A0A975HCS6_9SPHN|nr:hypothetical protein HY78_12050 [Rhizorhabdus wittichii DC-6]QTH20563.1 hypothetical protein HRJ34_19800 [Rhizorhabdus wittichii]
MRFHLKRSHTMHCADRRPGGCASPGDEVKDADPVQFPKTSAILLAMLVLAACKTDTEFDERGGFRIARSACPAAAIPTYTGDITLFNPPAERRAEAIDVTASIANLRATCNEAGNGPQIQVTAEFDVQARRATAGPARTVTLPWFATVLRAGTKIESKQLGQVSIVFPEGQLRGAVHTSATAMVSRAAATLPEDVVKRINRKRKAGDADAALDPMNEPTVRDAVNNANFELLIGFQLTESQLAYNAAR